MVVDVSQNENFFFFNSGKNPLFLLIGPNFLFFFSAHEKRKTEIFGEIKWKFFFFFSLKKLLF